MIVLRILRAIQNFKSESFFDLEQIEFSYQRKRIFHNKLDMSYLAFVRIFSAHLLSKNCKQDNNDFFKVDGIY